MNIQARFKKEYAVLIGIGLLLVSFVSRFLYTHAILQHYQSVYVNLRWLVLYILFYIYLLFFYKTGKAKLLFAAIFIVHAVFCISDYISVVFDQFTSRDTKILQAIPTLLYLLCDTLVIYCTYKETKQTWYIRTLLICIFLLELIGYGYPRIGRVFYIIYHVTYHLALILLVPKIVKSFKPKFSFSKKVSSEAALLQLKTQFEAGEITEQEYFVQREKILSDI